jgi:hypothetical protein
MLAHGEMIQYTIICAPSLPWMNTGATVAFNSWIWEQCEATDNFGASTPVDVLADHEICNST